MQDPPEVTVHDPSRPAGVADVLDAEPAPRRRWPAVAALLALVLVAGGLRVLDDRRDAAERARLDGLVDVALVDGSGREAVQGARISSRASLVTLDVALRNDGPRRVVLDRTVVGDFRFLGDLAVEPGQTVQVQLLRTVTCPADGAAPPLDPVMEGLRLDVVTLAGPRSVLVPPGVLPLDRLRTVAQRSCGYLPAEEAVQATANAGPDGRVSLLVSNASLRPLELLEVRLGAGLRLVGQPRLPRPLPPTAQDQVTQSLRLDLLVEPVCGQGPPPAAPLRLVVGTGRLRVGPLTPTIGDLSALRERYAAVCS